MPTTKAKKLDPSLLTTEHLHAYAREVAGALEGWSYRANTRNNDNTAELVHTASGAVVDLHLDGYRGQLKIAPSTWVYDRELNEHVQPAHGFERVEITVSLGRPAASVARDMDRRGVLANALKAHASIESERVSARGTRSAQSAAIELLNASGLLARPAHTPSEKLAYWHTEGEARGCIKDGRVTLDAMTLSPEQALKVMRALAE